jgi:hypothetical protein
LCKFCTRFKTSVTYYIIEGGGNIGKRDSEKVQRYAITYALETKKGVERLLNDYYYLKARSIDNADYPAVDILLDLRLAVELAGLTDRQRQALLLVYIERKTQEEAARDMGGISQVGVHYHIQAALRRIASVYRRWRYGEVTVVFRDEGENEKPVIEKGDD